MPEPEHQPVDGGEMFYVTFVEDKNGNGRLDRGEFVGYSLRRK